jgi:putative membrane protein insertion efficiency factor
VTLSPLLGGFCRYLPSCSVYAEEAIRRYGARRGIRLAAGRVLRCHPFRPGGIDPVP